MALMKRIRAAGGGAQEEGDSALPDDTSSESGGGAHPLPPAADVSSDTAPEDPRAPPPLPIPASGNVVPVRFSGTPSVAKVHPVEAAAAAATPTPVSATSPAMSPTSEVAADDVGTAPPPERQRQLVRTLAAQAGDDPTAMLCVLDKTWWDRWCAAVAADREPSDADIHDVGPIDNSRVVEVEPETKEARLRPGMEPEKDYVFVSQNVWEALYDWYPGGPVCEVSPVATPTPKAEGVSSDEFDEDEDAAEQRRMRRGASRSGSGTGTGESRDVANGKRSSPRGDAASLLASSSGSADEVLPAPRPTAADVRDGCASCLGKGAMRCKACHTANYCSRRCQKAHWPFHKKICKGSQPEFRGRRGLVGLRNLGNTCFMNSAVQCLSHCWPLTVHFLSDRWAEDLNTDNPIGTPGQQLTREYAKLIKAMWFGNEPALPPLALKRAIAVHAEQFQGFGQHDAHELLNYMLDGIHEDLNLVKRKEYVEDAEAGERPDAVVAAECWDKHKRRNRSVVVDHFVGITKSTVECPECDRVAVKFEPFSSLHLSLPRAEKRNVRVFVVRRPSGPEHRAPPGWPASCDYVPPSPPILHVVSVRHSAAVREVKIQLAAQIPGLRPDRIFLADVFRGSFYQEFTDEKPVARIREDDTVVAYEMCPILTTEEMLEGALSGEPERDYDSSAVDAEGNTLLEGRTQAETLEIIGRDPGAVRRSIVVVQRQVNVRESQMIQMPVLKPMGLPELMTVPARTTCAEFRELLWYRVRRYAESRDPADLPLVIISGDDDISQGTPVPNDDRPIGDVVRSRKSARHKCSMLGLDWVGPHARRFTDRNYTAEKSPTAADVLAAESKRTATLQQCFKRYTETEVLSPENEWYCSRCEKHQRAILGMRVWQFPEILVVALKRFSYRNAMFQQKIGMPVAYPLRGLDLTKHELCTGDTVRHGDAVYDLFAVVNHYGSMGFGHYTAFANRTIAMSGVDWFDTNDGSDDTSWLEFDDNAVRRCSPREVVTKDAYVLFYRRRYRPADAPPAPIATSRGGSGSRSSARRVGGAAGGAGGAAASDSD